MSREQYQPPATGAGQTDFGTGTTGASNTGFQASGSGFEDTARPVHYLCGDCDNKVTLKRGDPIRCKECGYRVLYKERTNRCVSSFCDLRWMGRGLVDGSPDEPVLFLEYGS